jgi:hypothetical protein
LLAHLLPQLGEFGGREASAGAGAADVAAGRTAHRQQAGRPGPNRQARSGNHQRQHDKLGFHGGKL